MISNKLEQLSETIMVNPSIRQIMPKWLEKVVQRRAFQTALSRAYAAWTPANWEWVDYSFNEHFLTHQVAPYVIRCLEEVTRPDPVQLAKMWAEQFTWFDEEMRQRHVARLIPAISDFLSCLEEVLRAHSFRSLALAQNVAGLSVL